MFIQFYLQIVVIFIFVFPRADNRSVSNSEIWHPHYRGKHAIGYRKTVDSDSEPISNDLSEDNYFSQAINEMMKRNSNFDFGGKSDDRRPSFKNKLHRRGAKFKRTSSKSDEAESDASRETREMSEGDPFQYGIPTGYDMNMVSIPPSINRKAIATMSVEEDEDGIRSPKLDGLFHNVGRRIPAKTQKMSSDDYPDYKDIPTNFNFPDRVPKSEDQESKVQEPKVLEPIVQEPSQKFRSKVAAKPSESEDNELNDKKSLLKALSKLLNEQGGKNCGNCSELEKENEILSDEIMEIHQQTELTLRPVYHCDKWDKASQTCWLNRNVGDTVTFVLSVKGDSRTLVQWTQIFHNINPNKRASYIINPDNLPWNVVVGSSGHELRLSPITEMDLHGNSFTATPVEAHATVGNKLHFRIRPVPIDLGFVYPGETLILNIASFVELPLESLHYSWYMEKDGEGFSLPSNMKRSASGRVLTILELRKEQEGIVSCSVYTNLGYLVAIKRFLITEMRPNEVMMEEPTNAPTTKRSLMILTRSRRQADSEDFEYEEVTTEDDTEDIKQQEQQQLSISDIQIQETDSEELKEKKKKPPPPEIVLEMKRGPFVDPEVQISRIISRCDRADQCSGHAECIMADNAGHAGGYCKCKPHYYGNGISCWEDIGVRRFTKR